MIFPKNDKLLKFTPPNYTFSTTQTVEYIKPTLTRYREIRKQENDKDFEFRRYY